MKAFAIALLSLLAIVSFAPPQTPGGGTDPSSVIAQAERYYAEHSYSRAHELYQSASSDSPAQQRWILFRRADTLWRADAATSTPDPTTKEEARKALEALIAADDEAATHDNVDAEAHESLGDLFWQAQNDFGQAWPHYQAALDYWAGARELDQARLRYLAIVFKASERPDGNNRYYSNSVPLVYLENAASIAQTAEDQGHAHFLLAMQLRYEGDLRAAQRAENEFKSVVALGKRSAWYDDALNAYGEWLENQGTVDVDENGQVVRKPDFVRALEMYRRITSEFSKGETAFYDTALNRARNIVDPSLAVMVSNVFLPSSEAGFTMTFRNVTDVDFTIRKVNLTSDVRLDQNHGELVQSIPSGAGEQVRHWSVPTGDDGRHVPGSKFIRVSEKLPTGAYLLEARSGTSRSRDLILVSDAAVVLKTSGTAALVYVADAVSGAPIPSSRVVVWESRYENGTNWYSHDATTDASGLARVTLDSHDSGSIVAVAASGSRQAFATGYSRPVERASTNWRIYAVTDRPAYRPGEAVQWKFTGRTYDGTSYAVPADRRVQWTILDPRGSKISEGTAALNEFGSAWDSLPVTESMPLGSYSIQFRQNDTFIGQATLFRLEEYKLPEFVVSVETPEENGAKKTFRPGDSVEVTVRADYYFGGPVSNATVEAVVFQQPYVHYWPRPLSDYPWFFEDEASRQRSSYYYGQQQVSSQTLHTDDNGRATLRFDTAPGAQDMQYRIEARVTDASRREVSGTGYVRVTRAGYYVDMQPAHYLYRPQDPVSIDVRAADANDHPLAVTGKVRVTRDSWYEIWIDPAGHEVSGTALQKVRERERTFPPAPVEGIAWRLKERGYRHEEIVESTVSTGPDGEAEFKFKPEREGYYRVAWSSPDRNSGKFRTPAITAETTVWVATTTSADLQYGSGGLELIADKDSFRAGQRAPVMLVTPASGRYVLFTVEREDILRTQLVHLDGTVKLIDLEVPDTWVPNIFLSAAMVANLDLAVAEKEIVVPPVRQFMTVALSADRTAYEPGDRGRLTVTTTDENGRPIPAEVSLGVADASVYAIQDDTSPDPRLFFYGAKRPHFVATSSSFQQRRYARLVEGGKNVLIDERDKEAAQNEAYGGRQDSSAVLESGVVGGVVGGAMKSMARDMVSPSATPAPKPQSPAEAITVTAAPENVTVRSDFRSTAYWKPDIVTDRTGKATVEFSYPDSLTTWRATARALTASTQVGMQTTETRTRKQLMLRLQAPRFFVAGDTAIVSALIDNDTSAPMDVTPSLDVQGLTRADEGPQKSVNVPANGQTRVDWKVRATTAGMARLRVTGRAAAHSDSMENEYRVYEHGLDKLVAHSGKVRGSEAMVRLDLPAQRRATTLSLQVTPSMAVTMLDALPYLINYPYGCTEQTMSRFLPTVITLKTLKDLGLSREAAAAHLFGGIEPANASATHPGGRHDLEKIDEMTRQGLARLYDFQHSDGGWGWWKDGESDHYMSAYVVWGLSVARDGGVSVDSGRLARGVQYLLDELVKEENEPDQQAWMLHALSAASPGQPSGIESTAFENLYSKRDRLNAYTRALLALAAHQFGLHDRAQVLVRNLEDGVKLDRSPDRSVLVTGDKSSDESVIATAHWGEDGIWWRWSDGGVESTAFVLRALLAIDPKNVLIEPVTNWLVKNRRGAQWSNTRDTAIVVLALNDYLLKSGELTSPVEFSVTVNGREIAHQKLAAAQLLSAPSRFEIPADLVSDRNEIRIRRLSGPGAIYFAAEARFFSLEEPVTPAGNEMFVKRLYYRLVARPTLLKGVIYDRVPLLDGGTVRSGERIEVVSTIETKNNYEYLLFEDLKPAGFEAVELRSGEDLQARELSAKGIRRKFEEMKEGDQTDYTSRSRSVYRELRDRKVAMFVDKLPQGVWEIQYTLRAEVPGTFHALPLVGQAMYVPEIRANGEEIRVTVQEQ